MSTAIVVVRVLVLEIKGQTSALFMGRASYLTQRSLSVPPDSWRYMGNNNVIILNSWKDLIVGYSFETDCYVP